MNAHQTDAPDVLNDLRWMLTAAKDSDAPRGRGAVVVYEPLLQRITNEIEALRKRDADLLAYARSLEETPSAHMYLRDIAKAIRRIVEGT